MESTNRFLLSPLCRARAGATLLGLGLLLAAPCARAADTEALDGFRCAHRLLGQALAAAGGEARVAAVAQIEGRAEGPSRNAYQGFQATDVDDPRVDGQVDFQFAFDFAAGRYRQQTWQRLRGGLDLGLGLIATGTQVTTLRLAERTWQRSAAPTAEAATAQAVDQPARLLPFLLLRRARENLPSLRCVEQDGGLAFNWDARTRIHLSFDERLLVSEAAVLQPDVLDGETVVTWRYAGRQVVDGLVLPEQVRVFRRAQPLFELRLQGVRINAPLDAAQFAVPAGFKELDTAAGPALATVEVAEGLWEVRGISGGTYRTPVIEQRDFLIVFDAPLSVAVTRQVIAQLRQRFPNKPVRYAVLSHFHTDHSAGLPAYAELGATLVTTPSDRPFVERMLAVRSVLQLPVEPGAAPPRPARLITVDQELDLPEVPGVRALRLRGSAHVSDTLVLHHAASRSVLEGDLYSTLTPFNGVYAWFAEWLAGSPLSPRRVVGIHHEPIGSEELIELARRWRAPR